MSRFFYSQAFTNELVVDVHHKFGVTPNLASAHDEQAQVLLYDSVVHTESKTTFTFPAPVSGAASVRVSEGRVGTTRLSADGTEWAMFVTNEGMIRQIKVPAAQTDLEDGAAELAARVAARSEELRQALVSMSQRRYEAHNQRKISQLLADAMAKGVLPNRLAYLQGAVGWLDSLFGYYAAKAAELAGAAGFAALDAVDWDVAQYDQAYDAATAPQGDPEVSVFAALAILD